MIHRAGGHEEQHTRPACRPAAVDDLVLVYSCSVHTYSVYTYCIHTGDTDDLVLVHSYSVHTY